MATSIVRDRSYRAAPTEPEQLGAALRRRPVVDQACGIVMHVLGCDADAAFTVLRRISQGTNRKLAEVASAVVERRGRGLEREPVSLCGNEG
ncbi:ANTAR domain-containing protein [Streptomyces sp. HM190]|uniref:ANTAR domain-containing protein n=1 Tax=Streptomyces sp. HM190 TaxID=2695266 RepID=UPI001F244855|nr:ANTAR domain-containing protein [Streptomyces sp. HM190]